MSILELNTEKCIGCKACAIDCPIKIIDMSTDNLPYIIEENEEKCMGCQHCMTICPTAALTILGKHPDASIPANEIANASQMDALIRNRRSVRQFKQNDVSKEKLDQLIKAAANAPTGKNTRTVNLHVIDSREQLNKFADKIFSHIEQMDAEGKLTGGNEFYATLARGYRQGTDVVFRGAPHVVVASAPKSGPTPLADGFIALSYMELMAYSMGLGAVWVGFLMYIFNLAPELTKLLNIPEDHEIAYALLLGEPSIKYHRGVQRDEIEVNRVTFD
jgi:nitroreductase/NAD-dependent dihydropyrimidine dehydrogenase PreA subunit